MLIWIPTNYGVEGTSTSKVIVINFNASNSDHVWAVAAGLW